MSLLSHIALRGALTGLVVLIGAANGPANAMLSANSLSANSLTTNALTTNALSSNALTSNALVGNSLMTTGVKATGLDALNGVTIEVVSLSRQDVR